MQLVRNDFRSCPEPFSCGALFVVDKIGVRILQPEPLVTSLQITRDQDHLYGVLTHATEGFYDGVTQVDRIGEL